MTMPTLKSCRHLQLMCVISGRNIFIHIYVCMYFNNSFEINKNINQAKRHVIMILPLNSRLKPFQHIEMYVSLSLFFLYSIAIHKNAL